MTGETCLDVGKQRRAGPRKPKSTALERPGRASLAIYSAIKALQRGILMLANQVISGTLANIGL